MKQGNGVGRRTFLKNVALTSGLAARDENATEQKRGTGEERASKSPVAFRPSLPAPVTLRRFVRLGV